MLCPARRLAQVELAELGLSTRYEKLSLREALNEEVWQGIKSKYWKFDHYFLPVCEMEETEQQQQQQQQQ